MAGTTGARGRGARRTGIVGINVTPLVDVVLVLLIIMMVSARYIVSRNLRVELPKAAQSDAPAASPVSVTIRADGSLAFGTELVDEERLKKRFAEVARPETDLVVSADAAVQHGRVVQVVDFARTAGITRFAIQVRSPEK
ncbi:MAG: ExbD/TolR family protein [Bradymonadia bacterium]